MLTDQDGGAQNGRPATPKRPVEHDGKGLVGDDIAQQQRDKDPMLAFLQQTKDLGGVFALGALARRCDDLEVDFVLSHEPGAWSVCCSKGHVVPALSIQLSGWYLRYRQSRKCASKQDEHHGGAEVGPEARIAWILGQVLFEHADGILHKREALDDRRECVEEASYQHVEPRVAGREQAIGEA